MLSTNGRAQPLDAKSPKDPFDVLSKILKHQSYDFEFWWQTTAKIFAQIMRRSSYPLDRQYEYLLFYYFSLIPELGPAPHLESKSGSPVQITKPTFRSYMTDDHTPVEISWQTNESGDVVARFSIDPIITQSRGMGVDFDLFEKLSASDVIAPGLDLEWCRVCAKTLTVSSISLDNVNKIAEYPSQFFIGFDCCLRGIVLKAYFMPEVRSKLSGVSKVDLVSQCVQELSMTADPRGYYPSDLKEPWSKVTSFFESLGEEQLPNIPLIAVDCLPAKQNRLKVYCRTPLATLFNLRRYLFFGRLEVIDSNPTLQRGLTQIELIWNLLFPNITEDVEPLTNHPNHPTGGLLFYYEIRGGQGDPFPKVYIPVRHLCPNDAHIVEALSAFYERTGNDKAAKAYKDDIQEILKLNAHSGIHTYVSIAIKQKNIEVTSYFNPECYSGFECHMVDKGWSVVDDVGSLPASPPSRHSPLPLVLPSLSLQHDTPVVRDSYIILGSQPSIKSDLVDFLDIQALNVDFYQTDNVYDILTLVCDAILDRFRAGLPSITSSPLALTSHDLIAQSHSRFFTAAILVLSSSTPTPLERRLISTLSCHIPVIPVVSHHRRRRLPNSDHPPPLTPLQLKTILFHSPQAIYKIQQEAAHRFLSTHYSQSINSQKFIQTQDAPCYQQYSSITLDPLHLPSFK
ncbi:hypothetical protein Clacol_009038 [Clathrus columnatus]|uniref:Uncharacterized protein n=1 Tax=Clathrus columnatus TaxID=1419009 RepID=A0AAV5ASA3_9AGAM|nr:hypothetical protein Clacol_009038 [Clathrus columnatus]